MTPYIWFDRWCKQFEGVALSGKRKEIWEFIESERNLAKAEAREEMIQKVERIKRESAKADQEGELIIVGNALNSILDILRSN